MHCGNCKKENDIKSCPCTYLDCDKKGICCECIAYHKKKDELPACYFSTEIEKTYNRSIQNFIKNK